MVTGPRRSADHQSGSRACPACSSEGFDLGRRGPAFRGSVATLSGSVGMSLPRLALEPDAGLNQPDSPARRADPGARLARCRDFTRPRYTGQLRRLVAEALMSSEQKKEREELVLPDPYIPYRVHRATTGSKAPGAATAQVFIGVSGSRRSAHEAEKEPGSFRRRRTVICWV